MIVIAPSRPSNMVKMMIKRPMVFNPAVILKDNPVVEYADTTSNNDCSKLKLLLEGSRHKDPAAFSKTLTKLMVESVKQKSCSKEKDYSLAEHEDVVLNPKNAFDTGRGAKNPLQIAIWFRLLCIVLSPDTQLIL